ILDFCTKKKWVFKNSKTVSISSVPPPPPPPIFSKYLNRFFILLMTLNLFFIGCSGDSSVTREGFDDTEDLNNTQSDDSIVEYTDNTISKEKRDAIAQLLGGDSNAAKVYQAQSRCPRRRCYSYDDNEDFRIGFGHGRRYHPRDEDGNSFTSWGHLVLSWSAKSGSDNCQCDISHVTDIKIIVKYTEKKKDLSDIGLPYTSYIPVNLPRLTTNPEEVESLNELHTWPYMISLTHQKLSYDSGEKPKGPDETKFLEEALKTAAGTDPKDKERRDSVELYFIVDKKIGSDQLVIADNSTTRILSYHAGYKAFEPPAGRTDKARIVHKKPRSYRVIPAEKDKLAIFAENFIKALE
ncbi:MAG: hypothetical protein OXC44_02855, partial [Proteobacteria bacterium]|nr:hypothetical protein [Pseudomonadota bacterium]